jgi:hypothetical protein
VPTIEQHRSQAARFARLAESISALGEFEDWAVVARAYSALHLVDAYFAAQDVHHETHRARNQAIGFAIPEVARRYVRLQELSRVARYGPPGALTAPDLDAALEAFEFVEAALQPRL